MSLGRGLKLLFLSLWNEFRTLTGGDLWNQNNGSVNAQYDTEDKEEHVANLCRSAPHFSARIRRKKRTQEEWKNTPIIEIWRFRLETITIVLLFMGAVIYFRQMQANLRQAGSSELQLKEMRRQMELDEQPWVFAFDPGFRIENETNVIFYARVRNSGKTPALNMSDFVGFIPPTILRLIEPDMRDRFKKDILPPGGDAQIQVPPIFFNQSDLKSLHEGKGGYVFGTLWYDDIFRHSHTNQFCFSLTNGVFVTAGFHVSCSDAEQEKQERSTRPNLTPTPPATTELPN